MKFIGLAQTHTHTYTHKITLLIHNLALNILFMMHECSGKKISPHSKTVMGVLLL